MSNVLLFGDKSPMIEDLSKKVDKESGKGLSTNDYTDEEKQKLSKLCENGKIVNGDCNIALGDGALENNDLSIIDNLANHNIAIGHNAIKSPFPYGYAFESIAIGDSSLENGGGSRNISVGKDSLKTLELGNFNTVIGNNSAAYICVGNENICIGSNALNYFVNGNLLDCISKCIIIGNNNSQISGDNQVQIGTSGQTVYGASTYNVRSDARDKADIQDLTYNAYEFIKKIKPRNFRWNHREDYESEETISISEYENASEEIKKYCSPITLTEKKYNELKSDKEYYTEYIGNIEDDANKSDEISYKAYKFHYQYMSDESKKGKRLHNGFIAQEIKAVADEMGFDFAGFQDHKVNGGCDVYTLGYEQFIAPMVSAMQAMMKQIESLKNEVKTLKQN